ncbi:Zinc carboxypeptidase [Virgibacillus subterraneus]|uniref:Zinc carboxypeptidase n=1 Tax=Virgibacillus subterraneus TaxID=621109 RepID=A0A1H9B269_9BACI|nr:Zinc carboxypeptidase [Virgibacillus subterraneus]
MEGCFLRYKLLINIIFFIVLMGLVSQPIFTSAEEVEASRAVSMDGTLQVYVDKDVESEVLIEYELGTIINYQKDENDGNWLNVEVIIGEETKKGYVHKDDVTLVEPETQDLQGVVIPDVMNVYQKPVENSIVMKSIEKGTLVSYQTFINGWYEITLNADGKETTGYIIAEEVEEPLNNPSSFSGIALNDKTHVYSKASKDSVSLKSYPKGKLLYYQAFISGWYKAIVYVDGQPHTGYISHDDVEEPVQNQQSLSGIASNSQTNIYSFASKNSEILKSYPKGDILYYKTFLSNWYEALVYVNGEARIGYIHLNDVQEPTNNPVSLSGVAQKNKTYIYSNANKNSKIIKNYPQGKTLYYKTFIDGWYEALVYINEEAKTGYISASDVEEPVGDQKSLKGVSINSTTNVYKRPSRHSSSLKSYEAGQILYYKTYLEDWYEALVYVNGDKRTGYIHVNDVESPVKNQKSSSGYAVKKTHVHSNPSKNSSSLKSYDEGSLLYYKTFLSKWYEAIIYKNGVKYTGYIHKGDIEEPVKNQENLSGYALNKTLIYSSPSRTSKSLKSYQEGSLLYYKTFLNNWYEALIYKNGEKHIGYIHQKDVETPVDNHESMRGYAYHSKINVYSAPSKKRDVLKSYNEGKLLYYKTFMEDWYKALIYVNGEAQAGYIHKNDVLDENASRNTLDGIAVRDKTFVYNKTSRKSKKLKGYSFGSKLIFKSFTSNWYEAIIFIDGKTHTGYIHKNDVVDEMDDIGPIVNPKTVYSYNQMVSDITKLKNAYPGIIRTNVIGKSVEGRDIPLVKVGNGDKKITINSSHHAREWITTNLVMHQIDEYSRAFVNGTKIDGYNVRKLLNQVTIYYVPMVNPDGVTLNQFGADGFNNRSQLIRLNNGSTNFTAWKANSRGVDLNRQYPAKWENIRYVASSPGPYNYKGTAPLTEPEVQALYNFTKKHNFESHVAYHSSGEILYWAFNSTGKLREEHRKIAEKVSNKTGYSLYHPTNPSGGGYTDWVIESLKKTGLTPELSPPVGNQPVPLSYYDRIWRQNNSIGLLLAKEALK